MFVKSYQWLQHVVTATFAFPITPMEHPMPTTRRTLLATAGAALAFHRAASAAPDGTTNIGHTVESLITLSRGSNTALMRGDLASYRDLVVLAPDFTLMSPFGGTPTHGRDMTPERWAAMGRFFRNGDFSQQLVQAYGSSDMVVLALIEHSNVEVGGLPAQHWPLRVTLVYQRHGSQWQLAHRHADPLVAGVSHATAAAIARGDIR
jgi:ketosteroid isomerase-like protein